MDALITRRVTVRLGPEVRRVRVPGLRGMAAGSIIAALVAASLAMGNLSVTRALAGAVTVGASATASLDVGRPIAGTATATSNTTAALDVTKALAGAALSTSSAAGALSLGQGIVGTSSATASATGSLTIDRALVGTSDATAAAAGSLLVGVQIVGQVSGTSSASSDLVVARALAASAQANAATAGILSVARTLDGVASGTTSATGSLTAARPLAGSTTAQAAATGALLVGVGLAGSTTAQSTTTGSLTTTAPEDSDAAAYLNAQTTAPSSTERGLVDALVKGLKADGDWASLDWLVLHAAESAQAGRLNVRLPSKIMSAVNAPTFTANRGYTGDATAAYLDAGEALGASGTTYALNSAGIGIWINATGSNAGAKSSIGNVANSPRIGISPRTTAGNETLLINDSTGDVLMTATQSHNGHRAASRTGANVKRGFYNGNRVADLTTASVAINTTNVSLLRSGTTYTDNRVAVSYWGAGLSDAAVGRIHNRLNTYLSAKGAT